MSCLQTNSQAWLGSLNSDGLKDHLRLRRCGKRVFCLHCGGETTADYVSRITHQQCSLFDYPKVNECVFAEATPMQVDVEVWPGRVIATGK